MQEIVRLAKKSYSTLACKSRIVTSAIAMLALVGLELATMLIGATPALAAPIYTPSDQDQAMSSFVSAYYDPNNHFFYTDTQNHAEADLWTEAVDWQVVMDAYNRTKSSNYNQMIGDIFNHITSVYGANCGQWQVPNASNETLTWWAESSVQAYDITNNATYKTCAQSLFDKVYQSWDTTEAGGGIWTFNNQTTEKDMATNALAAMTAAQLSTILGDSSYLTKAQTIYTWIRSHLTNLAGSSGAVYDHYDNTSATVIMSQFSDNYGLFIGAALAINDAAKNNSSSQSINYLSDANNVANASLSNLTINGDGIIQYESDCNNNTSAGDTSNSLSGNNGNIVNDGAFVNENNTCSGGTNERALFKGIYAHYLGELAFNSNYAVSQSAAYGQVLDENAALAWNDRLPSSNLVGADWAEPAPTGAIKSWEAASAAEILQILPNNNNIATYQSEDATLQGGLSLGTQFAGYLSNSGYIQNWTQNGQSVSFTISAPAAGTDLLMMRYSAGAGNAKRYLEVNGAENTANIPTGPIYNTNTSNSVIGQITFPGTDNWNTYDINIVPTLLNQGNNTIVISFDSTQNSQNALNLDELTVTPGFPPPTAAASSNSVPSTTTTLASTSVTNPGSFWYYYPGGCYSGVLLPRGTPDSNILFSSITDNRAIERAKINRNGEMPIYLGEGSNIGKTGNSFSDGRNNVEGRGDNFRNGDGGNNVENRENSLRDSGNDVQNRGSGFANSENSFRDYGNDAQNHEIGFANSGDNIGKCGNRSLIPIQVHLAPHRPYTPGTSQPFHAGGRQQPYTRGFQSSRTSRNFQPSGTSQLSYTRGFRSSHTSRDFQSSHTPWNSQLPFTPVPGPVPEPVPTHTRKFVSFDANKKFVSSDANKKSVSSDINKKHISFDTNKKSAPSDTNKKHTLQH